MDDDRPNGAPDLSAAPDPSAVDIDLDLDLDLDDTPDDHDAPLDADDLIEVADHSADPATPEPVATETLSAEEAAALRAHAQELERNLTQLQHERRREASQLAQLDEQNRVRQIDADYRQGLAAVRREAANQADPEGFIAQYTAEWGEWRLREREAIFEDRTQKLHQAYTRASIPNFAQRVAQDVGLTAEEARDLLDYRPEQMVAEAKKMVRNRTKQASDIAALKQELDQIKREVAAGALPAAALTPATGRGPTRRIKAGTQEHLRAIFQAATG